VLLLPVTRFGAGAEAAQCQCRLGTCSMPRWHRAFGGRPRQYLGLRYLRVRACGFAVHHHSPDAANYVIYARLQRAICHRGHTELFELS